MCLKVGFGLDIGASLQLAIGVGKSFAVVCVEFPGLVIAVDHAVFLSGQESVLFHAHEAAVGALCDGCDLDLHLAILCHVVHQSIDVENLSVCHFY